MARTVFFGAVTISLPDSDIAAVPSCIQTKPTKQIKLGNYLLPLSRMRDTNRSMN